jgi:drug/metabolite transporter (DMT)-like permease
MSPVTRRNAWIAWVAVCVIWGTTYVAIKVALETIPPFLMGGLRNVIAGTLLASVFVARRRPLPPPRDWGRLAVIGALMFGLGNGGVVWGAQYLPSGLTAVMIATSPFWMVAVDSMFAGGERLVPRQWLGLAIGFAGIVLLVWPELSWSGSGATLVILGVIALQIACIGWSFASSYAKRHTVSSDVIGSAAMQMIFGGICLLVMGTAAGEWPRLSFNSSTAGMMLYLIFAGSLIAFAAYSYALHHLPVAVVSLYTYVNPVIAVALGTLLLDEPFHWTMVLAGATIVLGIVVVRPATRPRPARVPSLSVASHRSRS